MKRKSQAQDTAARYILEPPKDYDSFIESLHVLKLECELEGRDKMVMAMDLSIQAAQAARHLTIKEYEHDA